MEKKISSIIFHLHYHNISTIRKKRKADKRFGKKIDKVVGLITKQAS
jgi:hypothetical protein